MNDMNQDPGAAEAATVTGVLDAYGEGGFVGQFSVVEGARLECHSCGQQVEASAVEMSSLRRLEGASDPADMVAIVALTCPKCRARGTVVLGFGPAGSPEDGDVLGVLRDHRGDEHAPGNSSPGEVVGDDAGGAPASRSDG